MSEQANRIKFIQTMVNDNKMRSNILDQPLEGLLYDLNLLPETCQTKDQAMSCIAITILKEELKRIKK